MSASVKVANARNFANRLASMRMPASDKVTVNPLKADTYPVADRILQDSWNYVDASGADWGRTVSFTIPRSVGHIYELFLQVTLPSTASVSYTGIPAAKIIQQYQLYVGNLLIDCSGRAIYEANRNFSNQNDVIMQTLQAGLGAVPSQDIFMRLHYPGSVSVSVTNASNSHDESYGLPFPLNKCNNDMVIRLQLATAAQMATGTLPAAAPTLRLWYQAVWSSDESDNLVNNGKEQSIYIPGVYLTEYTKPGASLSSSTNNSVSIDSATQDAEHIGILMSAATDAQITAQTEYAGQALQQLELKVGGTSYYKIESTGDGKFRQDLMKRDRSFVIDHNDNVNYTYFIPLTINPYQIPGDEFVGVNIYRNNPEIVYRATISTTTGEIWFCGVVKCLYEITPSGSVNRFFNAQN